MDMEQLIERVNRLENQNCWLKRIGAGVALLTLALLLMGQASTVPEVIEARKFILRDSEGKGRAALAFTPDNAPLLVLNRPDGSLGATLEVGGPHGQPMFSLYDQEGKPRAGIGIDFDGSPGVTFSDGNGRPRLGLALSSAGSTGLVLYGNDAQPRALLGLSTNWSPFLFLADETGKPRSVWGPSAVQTQLLGFTNKKADYSLTVTDKTGKLIWTAP